VANKVHPGTDEISKADFEASVERKIAFTIPFDIKAATHAAKLGQTFAEANRASKAGAVLRDLAQTVIKSGDASAPVSEAGTAKKSLLGKIDLKGLLAKKSKAAAAAN
jgi:pilus assembly protein CpaE